jgi:hypothetical protein
MMATAVENALQTNAYQKNNVTNIARVIEVESKQGGIEARIRELISEHFLGALLFSAVLALGAGYLFASVFTKD